MRAQCKKSVGKRRFIGWRGLVLRPDESPYATRAYQELLLGPAQVVLAGDKVVVSSARARRSHLRFLIMWVYLALAVLSVVGFASEAFFDVGGIYPFPLNCVFYSAFIVLGFFMVSGRITRVNRNAELASGFRFLIEKYGAESWGDIEDATPPWSAYYTAQRLLVRGFWEPGELDQALAQIREAPADGTVPVRPRSEWPGSAASS